MIIDVKNLLTTYDLKSAVKKVRPIKTGGFVIPQQQPQKAQTGCCGLQIRKA